VPQSSVLGLILFLLYTADLLQLVVTISRLMHMQTTPRFTVTVQPSDAGSLIEQVSVCTDEVPAWMKANRLQLNPAKTEVLWCASSQRQHQIPTGPVRVGDALVSSVTAARDLGVYRRRRHYEYLDKSSTPSERVLQHCARSVACDGLFLSTPC